MSNTKATHSTTIAFAQRKHEELERAMTLLVRAFQDTTGCIITKVELKDYSDSVFVNAQVFIGRRTREERRSDRIPEQGSD